ncbi:MAG: diaminopimelate epimerase [Parachlamydiaceae bacterium]|nr:diaminopimelate epimerase [Parachlamydiaceae bacterium]
MLLKFSKYSGCGNDFILIDNRTSFFPIEKAPIVQKLCKRCTGIGADGVILLEDSLHSDFRMRIFNADGTEAEMCGNGIRCLMKFVQDLGVKQKNIIFETFLRPLAVSIKGDLVSVEMGLPFDIKYDIPLKIEGEGYKVHYINTGVPHIVLLTEALENFELSGLGPKFRHHIQFAPQGANLNVTQLMPNGELWNRTFERGVEGETQACGTGCAAVAVIANKYLGICSPIKVRTRSLELIEISIAHEGPDIKTLTMTGPAAKVFAGEVDLYFEG